MDYSGIGKRIKKYRDAAKMTQQELAEAIRQGRFTREIFRGI